jgi:hypothetical protein
MTGITSKQLHPRWACLTAGHTIWLLTLASWLYILGKMNNVQRLLRQSPLKFGLVCVGGLFLLFFLVGPALVLLFRVAIVAAIAWLGATLYRRHQAGAHGR